MIKNYYMESDYQAGMDRMAMEIETGIASPDILMGEPLGTGMRYMVDEETTAFLAGAHTVDSCAEVIQSRVEILLAERG